MHFSYGQGFIDIRSDRNGIHQNARMRRSDRQWHVYMSARDADGSNMQRCAI